MLELREAKGAFERIEEWLRDQGFFGAGAEDRFADLYLGYGLSNGIRRESRTAPPEPCRALPLAACVVRRPGYVVDNDNDTPSSTQAASSTQPAFGSREDRVEVGTWKATWTTDEYAAAVQEVRDAIARGDVYQVNLVQHLSASFAGTPDALAAALAHLKPLHPDPLVGDSWAIVSASPELFLARRGNRVWTMPIKGTRPAGHGAALRESEKDAAEHVMIVDLERNDLSRVCEPGTVRWPELLATRSLAGVEHMVSTVTGEIRPNVGLAELLGATFPGGSVTGAPKIAAVDLIAGIEPVSRGASMGAIGRVRGNGDFDLALTIRTFAIVSGEVHLWVGGGIVWDSDALAEVEESWTKARPLLRAVGGVPPVPSDVPAEVSGA